MPVFLDLMRMWLAKLLAGRLLGWPMRMPLIFWGGRTSGGGSPPPNGLAGPAILIFLILVGTPEGADGYMGLGMPETKGRLKRGGLSVPILRLRWAGVKVDPTYLPGVYNDIISISARMGTYKSKNTHRNASGS